MAPQLFFPSKPYEIRSDPHQYKPSHPEGGPINGYHKQEGCALGSKISMHKYMALQQIPNGWI